MQVQNWTMHIKTKNKFFYKNDKKRLTVNFWNTVSCRRGAGDNCTGTAWIRLWKDSFKSANHFLLIFEANLKVINA